MEDDGESDILVVTTKTSYLEVRGFCFVTTELEISWTKYFLSVFTCQDCHFWFFFQQKMEQIRLEKKEILENMDLLQKERDELIDEKNRLQKDYEQEQESSAQLRKDVQVRGQRENNG